MASTLKGWGRKLKNMVPDVGEGVKSAYRKGLQSLKRLMDANMSS